VIALKYIVGKGGDITGELKGETILQAIIFWFNAFLSFLISWNHRMFEVMRNLWSSSCPTPLFKQDHLEQVAQDQAPL